MILNSLYDIKFYLRDSERIVMDQIYVDKMLIPRISINKFIISSLWESQLYIIKFYFYTILLVTPFKFLIYLFIVKFIDKFLF